MYAESRTSNACENGSASERAFPTALTLRTINLALAWSCFVDAPLRKQSIAMLPFGVMTSEPAAFHGNGLGFMATTARTCARQIGCFDAYAPHSPALHRSCRARDNTRRSCIGTHGCQSGDCAGPR